MWCCWRFVSEPAVGIETCRWGKERRGGCENFLKLFAVSPCRTRWSSLVENEKLLFCISSDKKWLDVYLNWHINVRYKVILSPVELNMISVWIEMHQTILDYSLLSCSLVVIKHISEISHMMRWTIMHLPLRFPLNFLFPLSSISVFSEASAMSRNNALFWLTQTYAAFVWDTHCVRHRCLITT